MLGENKLNKVTILAILLAFTSVIVFTTGNTLSSNELNNITFVFNVTKNDEWNVSIIANIHSRVFNCSGLIRINALYRETRSISQNLLVVPLYYVIDSVCPKLSVYLSSLPRQQDTTIKVLFRYPYEYKFFSSMDKRVLRIGSTYIVPLHLFLDYYIYDGIVLASSDEYNFSEHYGLNIVFPRDLKLRVATSIARVAYCVSKYLNKVLGPSPRSPVVVVVTSPKEHTFVLPGTGYSLGGIVYAKYSINANRSLTHIVAHETVHGWIGKGPLRGDEAFVEGASELLALLGLKECDPKLYQIAHKHINESSKFNKYYSFFIIHYFLRESSLKACKKDLYLEALRRMYAQKRIVEITDFFSLLGRLAFLANCDGEFALELGRYLLGINETSRMTWLTHSTTTKLHNMYTHKSEWPKSSRQVLVTGDSFNTSDSARSLYVATIDSSSRSNNSIVQCAPKIYVLLLITLIATVSIALLIERSR